MVIGNRPDATHVHTAGEKAAELKKLQKAEKTQKKAARKAASATAPPTASASVPLIKRKLKRKGVKLKLGATVRVRHVTRWRGAAEGGLRPLCIVVPHFSERSYHAWPSPAPPMSAGLARVGGAWGEGLHRRLGSKSRQHT